MRIDIGQHVGSFKNQPTASREQLLSIGDEHFIGFDDENQNEVFTIKRSLAHWLLHNCQHELPEEKEFRRINRLSCIISRNGFKECWSKEPIIIDCDNGIIRTGVKRLYAMAYAKRAANAVPMKFLTN
jgi:hypothetical protein